MLMAAREVSLRSPSSHMVSRHKLQCPSGIDRASSTDVFISHSSSTCLQYRIKTVTNREKKPASSSSPDGLSQITQQDVKCKDELFATAPGELGALAHGTDSTSHCSQPGIRDRLYHLGQQCPGLLLWAQGRY